MKQKDAQFRESRSKTPLYTIPERMILDPSLTFLLGFFILVPIESYIHLIPNFVLPSVYLRILAYLQPKKLWYILSTQSKNHKEN
jgi:hypothetical protein